MVVRVLHIDDDADMRCIVEISLGLDPAFTIVSCASASAALAHVGDQVPDVFLCDVRMPDMDGPSLLTHLRQNVTTARIPVIFLTGHARPHELERFKGLGSVAIMAKPFEPTTLGEAVRAQLHTLHEEQILRETHAPV